jgi:hypothetical protein
MDGWKQAGAAPTGRARDGQVDVRGHVSMVVAQRWRGPGLPDRLTARPAVPPAGGRAARSAFLPAPATPARPVGIRVITESLPRP